MKCQFSHTKVGNFVQVWLFWIWAIIWKGLLEIWNFTKLSCSATYVVQVLESWKHCLKALFFSALQPSEQNTYADIEAAYKCLEESYGTKQEDIVLYGQSVGSGPTLDLAARLPQLRAVVLHSPILSGLRVMYPVKRSYWFDIYKVI